MKILHTSIAVKDMDESIRFYCDVLGLKLLRRRERPRNELEKRPKSDREIAFLGDGEREIEFTYWKDKEDWTSGDELDHIALAVPDMDEALKIFEENKVEIVRKPFSRGGSTNRVAFIKDPNDIWLEIFERK
jgi:lactoylglutathione lyase